MTTRVAKGHIKVETADITITSALVLLYSLHILEMVHLRVTFETILIRTTRFQEKEILLPMNVRQ